MELKIFNERLEFLGIIDVFSSLIWIRRYYKCGEFELHCNITEENLNLLQKKNIIWKSENEAGYIEYRNLKELSTGQEVLAIKGKLLAGYLNRRIITNQEDISTTTENVMRTLVEKNCINPTNVDRVILKLSLSTLKEYEEISEYQVEKNKGLLAELESLGESKEFGFKIDFNYKVKELEFDVYKGIDRSVNQSQYPPCVFSKEFENVLEQEYTDSLNNYKSIGIVTSKYEDSEEEVIVGEGIGLDRYEVHIQASSLTSRKEDGTLLTKEEFIKNMEEEGRTKLSEYKEITTFESKINVQSNLIYRRDFDLGDIVTCRSKKWNIQVDTRITEIEEVYEGDKRDINITFGNNIPTLIDKIRQVVK